MSVCVSKFLWLVLFIIQGSCPSPELTSPVPPPPEHHTVVGTNSAAAMLPPDWTIITLILIQLGPPAAPGQCLLLFTMLSDRSLSCHVEGHYSLLSPRLQVQKKSRGSHVETRRWHLLSQLLQGNFHPHFSAVYKGTMQLLHTVCIQNRVMTWHYSLLILHYSLLLQIS